MVKKILFLFVVLVVLSAAFILYQNRASDVGGMSLPTQNAPTYSLNLLSGSKYVSSSSESLRLGVKNQANTPIKDFESTYGYPLHLLVFRNDRTGFQHIHPSLNKDTGMFSQDLVFPLDGDYRLYAEFTETGKNNVNLESKLTVGDIEGYEPPQSFNINKSAAVSNGYIASFYFPPNDDSIGPTNTDFYAGQESTLLISLVSNGLPVKALEPYHGSLGLLTIVGPDLKITSVSAESQSVDNQSGLLTFKPAFQKSGYYKLFLETKSKQSVTIFNFALNIKESTLPSKNNN